MPLDPLHMGLKVCAQRNPLCPKNKLMQALTMGCLDFDSRAYIGGDKGVIEDCDIGEMSVPVTILKDGIPGSMGDND